MVHISPYRATQREGSYPRRSPCRSPNRPARAQTRAPRAAEPAHRHDSDAVSRAFSPPGAQSAANTGLHSEIGPESWHAATGLAVVAVSGVRQTAHDRGVRPGCGAAQADTAARETPQVGGTLKDGNSAARRDAPDPAGETRAAAAPPQHRRTRTVNRTSLQWVPAPGGGSDNLCAPGQVRLSRNCRRLRKIRPETSGEIRVRSAAP